MVQLAQTKIKEFDPLSEHFLKNPWSELKRMRESCRAYRHEGTATPVISFFHDEDIRAMQKDWQTWSSQRSVKSNKKGLGAGAVMIGMDPPEHTIYRKVVAPIFMPKRISALQPTIDQHTSDILDEAIDSGEVDFMEEVASKLATSIICKICGFPQEDRAFIRKWTIESSRDYGKGSFYTEANPEHEERVAAVHANVGPYIVEHIKTLRKSKTPSILLDVADQVDDDRIMVGLCTLMLGAGNDTASILMTNGLWELMQKPDQMHWLRQNPDKINQAVEEFLRCRGSLRRTERVAARDMEFDGVEINQDDVIVMWNASASRDPAVVPDRPDEFDVKRPMGRHNAFGSGVHMCIGNVLARMETRTLYSELLKRTTVIEETRGSDSFENWGNAILDIPKRYSVSLHSQKEPKSGGVFFTKS